MKQPLKLSDIETPYKKPPTDETGKEMVNIDDIKDDRILDIIPIERKNRGFTIERAKLDRLKMELDKIGKRGLSNYIPMICLGVNCPINKLCPIYRHTPDLVPLGEPCPIEDLSVEKLRSEVHNSVANQLGEDTVDFLVDTIIDDLITTIIMQTRIIGKISHEGKWLQDVPVLMDFSKKGDDPSVASKEESHPLFDQYIALQNHKNKLLEALVATPQAKVRANIISVKDESIVLAERRDKTRKLREMEEMIGDYEVIEETEE